MFEGKCDVVAMAEEELDKQDQKESQSEVIRAIRDVDIAIDQIRERFSLIFGDIIHMRSMTTSHHPINLRSDTQASGSCLPSKRMAEDAHETSERDRLWRHWRWQ